MCEFFRTRSVDVAHRNELVAEVPQNRAMIGGDPAGADDSDSERTLVATVLLYAERSQQHLRPSESRPARATARVRYSWSLRTTR